MGRKRGRPAKPPEPPTMDIASGWDDADLADLFAADDKPRFIPPAEPLPKRKGNKLYVERIEELLREIHTRTDTENREDEIYWRGVAFGIETALEEMGIDPYGYGSRLT